ncbi:MAG: hypothetical protein OXE43_11590 [Chloroflexi bacterium]|nr:hypothetical protein [Chloroflexota bacterium]
MLEQRYGALILGHLLTGDPVPELDNDATVVRVKFQARAESAVDDLLIGGRGDDGVERLAAVAVRRNPELVASNDRFVKLVASYLRDITDHWADIRSGQWRLGLSSVPSKQVQELADLSAVARANPSDSTFRGAVANRGREVRDRLDQLDCVVKKAMQRVDTGSVAAGELTWRFLSSLRVRQVRLESPDESDLNSLAGSLRSVTRGGTPDEASRLLDAINRLVGRYDPAGADVDEAMLRRDLVGSADLKRSSRHPEAWQTLDSLAERLRHRTGASLTDRSRPSLELKRASARADLGEALKSVGASSIETPSTLVVSGEPDVGKSALTLRAVEDARDAGAAITTVSLRDLPKTTVELEYFLRAPLREVLAGTEVDQVRLLVVDGAEAALEGRQDLLGDVAIAALKAGLGVAAVTRVDGERAVTDTLRHASSVVSSTEVEPVVHVVEGLTAAEVEEVGNAFPALKHLGQDQRSTWVLAQPGLVALLLRADASRNLADRALSEADVFAAVWSGLVRLNESPAAQDVSPDEREQALVALARGILKSGAPSPGLAARALPSLRSDGLLLSAGPTVAWSEGDEFASDLVRDFALARLLLTEGYGPLVSAGAPRWAIRAARLACQAALAASGERNEQVLREQQAQYQQMAAEHGERWAELPLEAMLPLGDALDRAWPAVSSGAYEELATLVRLALQRYVDFGLGQPAYLTPLAKLLCDHWAEVRDHAPNALTEKASELFLAWLRGLVRADAGSDPLRARLRDTLLEHSSHPRDQFVVEALALLGPDLDDRAEQHLRDLAPTAPGSLTPAVESLMASRALVQRSADLLAELTEAYYIELPRDDEWERGYSTFDDGVRNHDRTRASLASPMASWGYGPFWKLLASDPRLGSRTINRILDHGARVRAEKLAELSGQTEPEIDNVPGCELDLPGIGARQCIGDPHVWRWYRGSGVGPEPCVSALLAVERLADQLLDNGIALSQVVGLLLEECHNLAVPGLVVGTLLRHLDLVTDELDIWLSRPEVWCLESARLAAEGGIHIQGTDAPDTHGTEFRRLSFYDAAACLVSRAATNGDEDRVAALRECGRTLMWHARAAVPGLDEDDDTRDHEVDELITVAGWAATLDASNYKRREVADGSFVFEYELPGDLAGVVQPRVADLTRISEAYRLLAAYTEVEDRNVTSETIHDDLALARTLAEEALEHGPDPIATAAAVASSALVAYQCKRVTLDESELRWSADTLTACAMSPEVGSFASEQTMDPMGADRSAAAALPALLVLSAKSEPGAPSHERTEEALFASMTSLFDEVRRITATALGPVWDAACLPTPGDGICIHQVALRAAADSARDCRLGPAGGDGQREPLVMTGPLPEELARVATDDLMITRIVAPIVAAGDAAASECCVRDAARDLFDQLLDTYARGAILWVEKRYLDSLHDHHFYPAKALLSYAARGESAPLIRCLEAFAGHPAALSQLLHDLLEAATYNAELRASLPTVWPLVMATALDGIDSLGDPQDDRFEFETALASMIPRPVTRLGRADTDAVIEAANANWIDPAQLSDLVIRWIPLARGVPRCVDAAIDLLRTADPELQASVGLGWVNDLVDGAAKGLAGQCWNLPRWLGDLQRAGGLDSEQRMVIQRVVDGLAAHGDNHAVALQRAEE